MRDIERITSRDNRRLVHARRVRDGKEPGLIFIEGRRLAYEALRSGLSIHEGFISDGFTDREFLAAIEIKSPVLSQLTDQLFRSIADTVQPQGVILIAGRPGANKGSIESGLRSSALPIAVCLFEINNPLNLGAILRTAEAAGVVGVIASKNSVDVYSPKALRASMGASFRIPVWEKAAFQKVLQWAKEMGLVSTATSAAAPSRYTDVDWTLPRLLIFGSEAHGLGGSELRGVQEVVSVSMANDVESLNLAVTAGIILFEAKRQNAAA